MKTVKLLAIVFIALVLIIPLTSMQVADGFNWNLLDFLAAGFLLGSAGGGIALIVTKVQNSNYRIALIAAVLVILLLVWVELAVGIFPLLLLL